MTHRIVRRSWAWTIVLVTALGGASSHTRAKAGAQEPSAQLAGGIPPETLAQIDALIREKDLRSDIDRKIDSQLLYRLRMDSGQLIAPGISNLVTDVPYADDGHLVVDIHARMTPALAARLSAMGVEVLSSEGPTLRAHISISQVQALAALPGVAFIQPKQEARTSAVRAPMTTGPSGRQAIMRALAQSLSAAAINRGAQPNVYFTNTGQGSRSSEGDITHLAYAARHAFNVSGTGIKIGVLSDGVTNLAASQAAGDLGAVTVLSGQAGSGDEGTAMLEIIHDLAPGAQLYFATAFTSITSFASNIRALRTAGCDIIVDDVFYYVESPFQDGQTVSSNTNGGIVTQAVNDVTAAGALYFSSAGNEGNLNDGTSGVWEGDFVDGGQSGVPGGAGRLHSFAGQTFDVLTAVGSLANLYWSDPLGGSGNDYDLFRLNSAGALVASSTNIQSGTQDPYEQVSLSGASVNDRLVIVKKASALARFLHLGTNRGRLSISTAGETHGHSSAAAAFSVAATRAVGPFPNPFTAANVVETFSSNGPRRLFFQADGTPYTSDNFSSTGGLLRQKPDITAADGVSVTGVGGFGSPFYGTSASAPHAAAIAALLKSGKPALTPAQIRTALNASALDIEAPGVDRDSGAGIIMAHTALSTAGVPGTAWLDIASLTATENPGNGNGAPEAGEGVRLDISLANYGANAASSISALLTSSTPGITILQPGTHSYSDLPVSMTSSGSGPYLFTVASNYPCPQVASFTLTVGYIGGSGGSQAFNFQVPIGPPAYTITTTLDATAPPATPPFVATSTGIQTRRLFRDGVASVCGTPNPKAFPGLSGNPGAIANRRYEAFAFNTCSTSVASCVTVTLQGANAVNLFSAGYSPTFNSGNLQTNYKGDPGVSGSSTSYAFDLASGAQTFAVDVHEVNFNGGIGTQYTLKVAGACLGACAPPNNVPVAVARNVTVTAGVTGTANASIDDGSSDPDAGDVLTFAQSPPGPYPVGQTSVILTVTDPKGAAAQASGTVTVNPGSFPTPAISISDASVQEGNVGTVSAIFQVTLSNQTSATVTVNYATANLTAVAPADYQAASGMVTFGPGEVSKPISVLVNGDTATESTETFQVSLSAPVNGSISDGQAIGTIVDDDPATVDEATVSQAVAAGSARLQALQRMDGGWFFKVGDTDCGAGAGVSCSNTIGVTALGLLAGYTRSCASTCDASLLNSATAAGDYLVSIYDDMLPEPLRPFSQDIEFLVELGQITANATYTSTAQSWFQVLVNQYPTGGAGRVDAILAARHSENLRTLAAWDSASLIRAAVAVGNVTFATSAANRIVALENQWKDTNPAHRWDQCPNPNGCGPIDNPLAFDYTLLGEGSLLWAFHDLGGFGAQITEYQNFLVAQQDQPAGSWDAGDTQITAYITLGLAAIGGADAAIQSAVKFFLTTRLPSNGWPSYTIATSVGSEYTPSDAEVVRAMFRLYNTPGGSSVYVAPAQLSNVTFTNVADSGRTTVVAVNQPGHLRVDRGYDVIRGLNYAVRTTANVHGSMIACFIVPSIADQATFSRVRILHEERDALVDRTIHGANQWAPDFPSRRVCARVTSLDDFAVALAAPVNTPRGGP